MLFREDQSYNIIVGTKFGVVKRVPKRINKNYYKVLSN